MRSDAWTPSLAARIGLTAAGFSIAGVLLTGFVLMSLFVGHRETEFDAVLEDDVIHIASSLQLDAAGRLGLSTPLETPLYEQPGSGWVWQIRDRDGQVLGQSGSLAPGMQILAPMDEAAYFVLPDGVPVRGVAQRAILADGAIEGIVHVAVPRAQLDADVTAFRRITTVSLGGLGLGLILAVLVQLVFARRPLMRLASEIGAMRRGEGRPSVSGWPRELTPLVAELDALQDHNEALIDRGYRQAADLAHGLKTPLAMIQSLAEDAPGGLRADLVTQIRRMDVTIKRNLTRARSSGGRGYRTDVRATVDDLLLALGRLLDERGLEAVNLTGQAVFYGVAGDLEEILGNLIENAAKWASGRIEVSCRAAGDRIVLVVDDDGPGIPPDDMAAMLGRGARLDEAVPGHGMGLAIAVEICGLYSGQLVLGVSRLGGLRVEAILPGRIGPAPT